LPAIASRDGWFICGSPVSFLVRVHSCPFAVPLSSVLK
jgi:hypothetical protein